MTWIRISLENLHLTGTFTKLSSLNVKLLFSPPVYLYLSIIHIRLKLEKRFTGVYLLDFFCSGIQFYLLLSPYLCFISLLYLDLYVLGDDVLISQGLSCKPNIYVS